MIKVLMTIRGLVSRSTFAPTPGQLDEHKHSHERSHTRNEGDEFGFDALVVLLTKARLGTLSAPSDPGQEPVLRQYGDGIRQENGDVEKASKRAEPK